MSIYPEPFKKLVASQFILTAFTSEQVADTYGVSGNSVLNWARQYFPDEVGKSKFGKRQLLLAQEIVESRPVIRALELSKLVGVTRQTITNWKAWGWIEFDSQCSICGEHTPTKYCQSCRDKNWDYYVIKYPKVTYGDLLSMPDNCEICGDTEDLHLDHNHGTGEYRGLLCAGCNKGIGLLKEDINKLENAIEYLKTKNKI